MNSINPYNLCTQEAYPMYPGANEVTNYICHNTSAKEFDEFCENYPEYQLSYGGRLCWTALEKACDTGNVPLIRHIVKIGGKELLSLQGVQTPLHRAIACRDLLKRLKCVEELVNLGADVNLTHKDSRGINATPLLSAARKPENLKIVKLLLRHGAKACHEDPNYLQRNGLEKIDVIDDIQRNTIQTAQAHLKAEKRLFLAAWFKKENKESPIQMLPQDILQKIYELI